MQLTQIKEMIKQRHQRTPLKNTLYDMKEKFKRPIVTVTCEKTIKYLVNNKGMSYSEALTIANKLLNNKEKEYE